MGKRPATAAAVATGLLAGVLLGAAPAGAAVDLCVAANGAMRAQKGTADCEASGTGSTAIAKDAGSFASATGGDHNRARASGDGATAFAGQRVGGCRVVATTTRPSQAGTTASRLPSRATTTPPSPAATAAWRRRRAATTTPPQRAAAAALRLRRPATTTPLPPAVPAATRWQASAAAPTPRWPAATAAPRLRAAATTTPPPPRPQAASRTRQAGAT